MWGRLSSKKDDKECILHPQRFSLSNRVYFLSLIAILGRFAGGLREERKEEEDAVLVVVVVVVVVDGCDGVVDVVECAGGVRSGRR